MVIWANRYLEYRYRKGFEEGLEIGRREAKEMIRREQELRRWKDWQARYEKAIKAGALFNEPAPPKPKDVK